MQCGSGQETAVLICMENVSWEGDMEDTRRDGPGSEMQAPSIEGRQVPGDRKRDPREGGQVVAGV